ncbi:MAG: aldehyde dehydrogenase family protein [Saprospiraceae bacterium]|jgi:aldehyde dehydrogenase (NAD+)
MNDIENKFDKVFESLRQNAPNVAKTNFRTRCNKLKKVEKALMVHRDAIKDALYKDFKKTAAEVDLSEIYPILQESKFIRKRLNDWMRPHPVPTPLTLLGSKSWIRYEPKGVVLIIAPWNFPLNLTLGPLLAAIAAGNTVVLKPSEVTPHTATLIRKIIQDIFPSNEVHVEEGDASVAQALLKLPFHHIYFTGSPNIGKEVMKAAANHLSSITLELGGKSPTIIDETADLNIAAKRIAWAKFINNGQICIAPDYVFIHQSIKDQFVKKVKYYLVKYFGEAVKTSPDYCRMVNQKHFDRVSGYLDNALQEGAKVEWGGSTNAAELLIEPTLISGMKPTSDLLTHEIFGPILPVVTYDQLHEAIAFINAKEKPLALYIYSKSQKNIKAISQQTRAGATSINSSIVHYLNHHLPFGGVNNSGIGKGHGWYGFEAFSNARAEYRQVIPGAMDLLAPPYNVWKKKLIDFTLKWL